MEPACGIYGETYALLLAKLRFLVDDTKYKIGGFSVQIEKNLHHEDMSSNTRFDDMWCGVLCNSSHMIYLNIFLSFPNYPKSSSTSISQHR